MYKAAEGSFIEGVKDSRYELVVCNPTDRRILAVVSVDGVNVVTGETAGVQQRGYVIDPSVKLTISGFRKDLDSVAAFYFTSVDDSYAGRTDRPANVGIIGAAFFNEVPMAVPPPPPVSPVSPPPAKPPMQPMAPLSLTAPVEAPTALPAHADVPVLVEPPVSPAPMANPSHAGAGGSAPGSQSAMVPSPKSAEKLGTGHGEIVAAEAVAVDFTRQPTPFVVMTLRYESRARLQEMGVLPRAAPQAFPASGFTPDPPPRRY